MKATLITRDNKDMLAQRYGVETEEFEIGYFLIAEFGDNGEFRHQGMLTGRGIGRSFHSVERSLENEFLHQLPASNRKKNNAYNRKNNQPI